MPATKDKAEPEATASGKEAGGAGVLAERERNTEQGAEKEAIISAP